MLRRLLGSIVMNLNVNEIFYSVQGEGPLVGMPSVFLRLNGCNLRCPWCDSKFTWLTDDNPEWGPDEVIDTFKIANDLASYTCNHIVITGGEPLLQQDAVYELIGRFGGEHHFTVETNGTIDPHPDFFEQVDLWMVSPKKGQKIEASFWGEYMTQEVWYKFVVDRKDGMEWIDKFIADWELRKDRIMLMPQATMRWNLIDDLPWVIELAKERCYRVSPRMHITAYGNKRGV